MATNSTTTAPISGPILQSPLPGEVLSHLYSNMLKARMLSKKWRKAQQTGEAVLAAAIENTEPTDMLVSAGPHPILDVLGGTPVSEAALVNRGKASEHGSAAGRVVVAGADMCAGMASGLAFGLKTASSSSLVLVFLPGADTHGKAWEQATEFAATNRLPIVFVADGTSGRPTRKHEGRELSHWPFPTIAVDGRDVIAVYRVTKEAISAARRGHGPTLVDCVNFLAPGRRGKDERDPLASFRGYLKRHNAWSEEWAKNLEAELAREIKGQ